MKRQEELKNEFKRQLDAMSEEQRKRFLEQLRNDPAFMKWLSGGLKGGHFQ